MHVRTLDSINAIDPVVWNSIVPRCRLICRHEYLRAVESSKINDCRYFYPVVYDDSGRVIAHACFYTISTELDSFAQGVVKQAICQIRRLWRSFLILRSVECGTPVALGNTISFIDGCDHQAVLGLLVMEIEAIARLNGVSVLLFRDFFESEKAEYDSLISRGFSVVPNLPTTRLEIKWSSFDQYLGHMRRKYRRRIQEAMRLLDCPEVSVEVVQDYGQYAETLVTLWRNVFDRAKEYKREVLTADMFRSLAANLPGDSSVLLVKINGNPVAFALLLYDGDTLVPLFCGLDYSHNERYALYMSLMNLEVRHAIDKGMKHVDFGITTLLPKQELGAEVLDLCMYMKHLNPLMNRIVPGAFRHMTPVPMKANLRVFKEGVDG